MQTEPSMNTKAEIDQCLAYEVLREPDEWLGTPSPSDLQAFLLGAESRASCVRPSFPRWRVFGALEEPEFYTSLVAATGHPSLTIKWATAVEMTNFSLAAACAKLYSDALAWHREHGVNREKSVHEWQSEIVSASERARLFWEGFTKRPAMYLGSLTGWRLYCFLSGMDRGGDWLALPQMPMLSRIINYISDRSKESYGSSFAAFRVCDAEDLLEWAGLKPGSSNAG